MPMKNYFTILYCLLLVGPLLGQQQAQYTQFVYNKLALNPGYAGSDEAIALTALYRTQWIGLEGAPTSQVLSFNAPLLNRRIGLGLLLSRHSIGISEQLTAEATYAYRVRLGKGSMGIGLQASVRRFGMDYTDSRLKATQNISSDGGIAVGDVSRTLLNFGVGVYYHTSKFYIGGGIPRLIRNSIDFNELSGVLAREVEHGYLMTGLLMELGDFVALRPQLLLKYAPQLPMDAELNLSLILAERFTFGATYRLGGGSEDIGESIDVLLAAQLTRELLFGLSYDITMSELKDYNNGSIEAVLRYYVGHPEGDDIINPRFF